MEIINANTNHSGNWIVAEETKPKLKNGQLFIENTRWSTRGGHAEIQTIVVINDENLTSLLIGYRYCGKYRGGNQYWKHYKNGNEVVWKKLSDDERLIILENYDKFAPNWANLPGKTTLYYDNNPKNPYRQPEIDGLSGCFIGYKWLIKREDGYHSQYSDQILWYDNSLDADKLPDDNNTNGIYAAKNCKSTILNAYQRQDAVLVKLLLSGKIVEFSFGYRAEHADILEEIL